MAPGPINSANTNNAPTIWHAIVTVKDSIKKNKIDNKWLGMFFDSAWVGSIELKSKGLVIITIKVIIVALIIAKIIICLTDTVNMLPNKIDITDPEYPLWYKNKKYDPSPKKNVNTIPLAMSFFLFYRQEFPWLIQLIGLQ